MHSLCCSRSAASRPDLPCPSFELHVCSVRSEECERWAADSSGGCSSRDSCIFSDYSSPRNGDINENDVFFLWQIKKKDGWPNLNRLMSGDGKRSFSAVSTLGIAATQDGAFNPMSVGLPLESNLFIEGPSQPAQNFTSDGKWKTFSERLLKNGAWGRLWRVLNKVPKDIAGVYDRVESNYENIKLAEEPKNKIFREFFRIASTNFGVLYSWEVEGLIQSDIVAQAIGIHDLDPLKKQRIVRFARKKKSGVNASDENVVYDFEGFISLLYEVMLLKEVVLKKKIKKKIRTFLPIDPDLPAKQAWDIFVVILLVYCSFDVPYSLAFASDSVGLSWTPYEIWGLCLDGLLFLDIGLTFVTAIDDKGLMVTEFREIANQYMRSWFLLDVAGTFPFDYVLQAVLSATMQSSSALQLFRVLKLVKMMRLLRTAKFFARLNQLSRTARFVGSAKIIAVFKAIFLLTFTAHTMGSFFTMILQNGPNWLNNYRNGELVDSDVYSRYIVSLYWATVSLTTMGYGDVVPANTSERLFCIFVALIGGCVFSFCIGSISSLITEVKGADHAYRARVRAIGEYLDFRGISPGLKRRIRAHCAHSWIKSGAPYDEETVLGDLNPEMRTRVLREIGAAAQRDVAVLEGLEEECAGYIFTRLHLVDFEPNETIYSRGDPASQMFIVVRGTVALLQSPTPLRTTASLNTSVMENITLAGIAAASAASAAAATKTSARRGPGDTFGELALFPDVGGTSLRPETAVALTKVTGYVLLADQVEELHTRFPAAVEQLRELCALRAIECQSLGLLPMPPPAAAAERGGATRLGILSVELRRELLRAKEAALLVDTDDDGSDVMHFLTPAACLAPLTPGADTAPQAESGNDESPAPWTSVSCVVSGEGRVLCLEHSTEGLKLSHPLSLGFLSPGRSTCVQLSPEEVAAHASTRGHSLRGCRLTVFPERWAPAAAAGAALTGGEASGRAVLFFSSAQHDFDELREAVADSLGPVTTAVKSRSGRATSGIRRGLLGSPSGGQRRVRRSDATSPAKRERQRSTATASIPPSPAAAAENVAAVENSLDPAGAELAESWGSRPGRIAEPTAAEEKPAAVAGPEDHRSDGEGRSTATYSQRSTTAPAGRLDEDSSAGDRVSAGSDSWTNERSSERKGRALRRAQEPQVLGEVGSSWRTPWSQTVRRHAVQSSIGRVSPRSQAASFVEHIMSATLMSEGEQRGNDLPRSNSASGLQATMTQPPCEPEVQGRSPPLPLPSPLPLQNSLPPTPVSGSGVKELETALMHVAAAFPDLLGVHSQSPPVTSTPPLLLPRILLPNLGGSLQSRGAVGALTGRLESREGDSGGSCNGGGDFGHAASTGHVTFGSLSNTNREFAHSPHQGNAEPRLCDDAMPCDNSFGVQNLSEDRTNGSQTRPWR